MKQMYSVGSTLFWFSISLFLYILQQILRYVKGCYYIIKSIAFPLMAGFNDHKVQVSKSLNITQSYISCIEKRL